ncbi:MAG: hypothetical protein BIFFINMI_00265 [Phycisphaerae bacterium]|nr:hypothetical protein [Phycisphaerae bacterium]
MWATGLLAGSWHLVRGLLKLRRRRARWQPVGNERVRRIAAVLAGKLGLRRPFQLLAADDLPTPVAVGVLHPAVVIPRDQFRHLASPEGRAVLVHELAHLRFLDPFWRLLGASITVLLWWHPLMRWLNRRIEIESEFLCDQAALGSGADRRGYARMLVGLAQIAWVDRPLAAAAIGAVHRTSHLERRVSMILSRTFGQVAAVSRRVRLLATALAIGLVLTLSSVSLLGEQNLGLTDNDASVAEAAQATPAVATVPAPKAIADQPTAAHDVAPAAPDPQVTRLEGMLDKARKALEEARALPESNPDRAQTIQLAELRVSRIQRTLDETRSAAQAKAPAPPPADGNSDTDANAVNGQDPSARSSDDEDEDEHEAEHENEREGDRRARGERREGERHEGDRRFGDRRFGWRPGGEGVRPPTTQPEGESDFAGNRAQFEQRRKQVEALRDQAQTLANESKWQEVIGILDQLKELIPEDPRLWGAYARTYDQMGEKEKAEAARVKMHEILAKLRIRRTFGALDNARARAAFESALAHAPGVRWEKSTDGSYAVTGTFFSQRRLAETHDRLTGNAPPTPPGDGAGRSDRFRRRGGEGENASGGERRRNQQPGGEREEDDD